MARNKRGGLNEAEEAWLEAYLESRLIPVEPGGLYARRLHDRLLAPEEDVITVEQRANPIRYILFGIAGVISSALILVTGVRGIISLINTLKKQKQIPAAPVL